MNEKTNRFIKKNFSWLHILGIFLGWSFSLIYWLKSGQFSESILKNNILIISLWGILFGYVTFDLLKSAFKKRKHPQE